MSWDLQNIKIQKILNKKASIINEVEEKRNNKEKNENIRRNRKEKHKVKH